MLKNNQATGRCRPTTTRYTVKNIFFSSVFNRVISCCFFLPDSELWLLVQPVRVQREQRNFEAFFTQKLSHFSSGAIFDDK